MNLIYEYLDYKKFVQEWVAAQPNGGRGTYQKISVKIRIHRATVSQVFSGDKQLSLEQASELSDFIGLKEDEGQYFLALVNYARAGSEHLKQRLERMLADLRNRHAEAPHEKLANKVVKTQQAEFYSHWKYSAISVLQTLPKYKRSEAIAERLGIPKKVVNESLSFLKQIATAESTDGNPALPSEVTYLAPSSPFIDVHRTHWRLQAIQRFPQLSPEEIAFSAPISLSEKDFLSIKKELRGFIEKLYQTVEKTNPETAVIFNVDWIRL